MCAQERQRCNRQQRRHAFLLMRQALGMSKKMHTTSLTQSVNSGLSTAITQCALPDAW